MRLLVLNYNAFHFRQTYLRTTIPNANRVIRRFSNSAIANGTGTHVTKPVENDNKGGIPWGLIIPLGLLGGIIGYFYRGHRNTKDATAFRTALRGDLVISPEELATLRESNKLTINIFNELARRAIGNFGPGSEVDLRQFLNEFCVDQLGGEFQSRRSFKQQHLIERMQKHLGATVKIETALLVLSMTLLEEPEKILHALFPILSHNESTISFSDFVSVLAIFDKTNQLPVRVLVHTTTNYPFDKFSRATPEEIAKKALVALNPDTKAKDMENFVEARAKSPIRDDDFNKLMLCNSICAWGACYSR